MFIRMPDGYSDYKRRPFSVILKHSEVLVDRCLVYLYTVTATAFLFDVVNQHCESQLHITIREEFVSNKRPYYLQLFHPYVYLDNKGTAGNSRIQDSI